MKQVRMTVSENEMIARQVYRLRLRGDTSGILRPGQFVNLKLEGLFLRRPISVCAWEEDSLTLIYKTVGTGTAQMSRLAPGAELDLLTGLGNGYDPEKAGEAPLLLGGGVGVPPLYGLARVLRQAGKRVTAVLGFNTAAEVFLAEEFRALGCDTVVATADGSLGLKGFVTDCLPEKYSYFYACGPLPMLRAVYHLSRSEGEFSLEERMGCGFGACMGCSFQTRNGFKRICREGPVLEKGEIPWDD